MKKFISYSWLISLFVFVSCLSVDYSQAEYYSVEEVVEAWEEGIYDYDLDQQMSAYWPDAYGLLHFDEERHPPECFGRDEIRALMEEIKGDDFDLGDFELPPYVTVPEIEDEVISVIYYYEEMKREEILIITRRDDLWGIQDHYFHYFEAEPVSLLTEWTDENRNGFIEPWELQVMSIALHELMAEPHNSENGLDEIFDADGDMFISMDEVIYARTYLARFALPRLVEQIDWFGPEFLDFNFNGYVEPEEMESAAEYLINWQSDRPLERPDGDPLYGYLDSDESGSLDWEEKNQLFWQLTHHLSWFHHPAHPLTIFDDEGMPARSEEPVGRMRPDDEGVSTLAIEKIRGKRIAVVDISSETEKINEETRKGLVFFVENSFVNTGLVKVVDRKSIEKIFEENLFQSAGMTDEETAVEIGKLVGAEIIVTGSVTAVGSNFYLQLRMIDVKTAEVVASSLGEAKIENEFLNMSSMAVDRLF